MIIENIIINNNLEEILYELRNQLSVNGINLLRDIKDSGDNIMVTCPYHKDGQERKPSGGFLKEDGTYHCFTCNTTHTLPEVVSHCFGRDDHGVYGMQWILKNFAVTSVEDRKEIPLDIYRTNHNHDNGNNQSNIQYVTEEELDSYRYYHPYMYERKLTNEIIELFDIGFDSNTNCITFPVRTSSGGCLFIARRSVSTKYFNYPSGVRKPIYGIYELNKLPTFPTEVIICESMLDALVCWVYGKYAVALNGLGSEEQYAELSRMPCRKFILATDNDLPGLNARKVLKNKIKNHLITEYCLPSGKKDMNDLTKEEFNKLIEQFC